MGKLAFIIVDGMGDLPIPVLNKKTPLEYAYKPNVSMLLKNAAYAFPSVLGKLAPQSDAGVLADLGYDPIKFSTGRGWFECMGLGMNPGEGDLSVRVNFGQVNGGNLVSVRTEMSKEELFTLEKEINSKVSLPVKFEFKSGESYRGGLILRAEKERFSAYVSNNEPGYTAKFYKNGKKLSFAVPAKNTRILPVKAIRKEGKRTAELLNLFIRKAVEVMITSEVYKTRKKNGLPLPNYLFLRDAAVSDPKLQDINDKYGKKWAAVVGMPLEKGIALATGMKLVNTGELPVLNEDLSSKADGAINALRSFDCVYLHIKQTDSASHLGKYAEKYAVIEAIDRLVIGKLAKELDVSGGDTLVLTCDHGTSSQLKRHINSNIPVLIINKKFGQNKEFGENSCKKHHLQKIRKATDIMPFIMKL